MKEILTIGFKLFFIVFCFTIIIGLASGVIQVIYQGFEWLFKRDK